MGSELSERDKLSLLEVCENDSGMDDDDMEDLKRIAHSYGGGGLDLKLDETVCMTTVSCVGGKIVIFVVWFAGRPNYATSGSQLWEYKFDFGTCRQIQSRCGSQGQCKCCY